MTRRRVERAKELLAERETSVAGNRGSERVRQPDPDEPCISPRSGNNAVSASPRRLAELLKNAHFVFARTGGDWILMRSELLEPSLWRGLVMA